MLWIIDEMRLTENLSNVAKTFKKAFHGRHDFLLEVQMLQHCECAQPWLVEQISVFCEKPFKNVRLNKESNEIIEFKPLSIDFHFFWRER